MQTISLRGNNPFASAFPKQASNDQPLLLNCTATYWRKLLVSKARYFFALFWRCSLYTCSPMEALYRLTLPLYKSTVPRSISPLTVLYDRPKCLAILYVDQPSLRWTSMSCRSSAVRCCPLRAFVVYFGMSIVIFLSELLLSNLNSTTGLSLWILFSVFLLLQVHFTMRQKFKIKKFLLF